MATSGNCSVSHGAEQWTQSHPSRSLRSGRRSPSGIGSGHRNKEKKNSTEGVWLQKQTKNKITE